MHSEVRSWGRIIAVAGTVLFVAVLFAVFCGGFADHTAMFVAMIAFPIYVGTQLLEVAAEDPLHAHIRKRRAVSAMLSFAPLLVLLFLYITGRILFRYQYEIASGVIVACVVDLLFIQLAGRLARS